MELTDEEKKAIEQLEDLSEYGLCYNITEEYQKSMKIVLNLIENQQKEIDRIKEYVHQEIVHYTETIKDYIDDGKEENKDFIGELKEEREHWKDIERILQDEPNEQLYMDWWKYGLYE